MATTIYFTETKDFKIIKDQILAQEDYFLVYVYADTTNVRIPKEMIRELPVYGNNLIWIDTANLDNAAVSNHIALTIGQLLNPEEDMVFQVVSKTAKFEKLVIFLRNQGIAVDWIGGEAEKAIKPATKTRKPRAAKKAKSVVAEGAEAQPPKKRGRPKKVQTVAESTPKAEKPAKKSKKTKTAAPKKTKVVKTEKPKKSRVINEFTEEQVKEKILALGDLDYSSEQFLLSLLKLPKIRRPKLVAKMVEMIKATTSEDDLQAGEMIDNFVRLNLLEVNPLSGKINYKD